MADVRGLAFLLLLLLLLFLLNLLNERFLLQDLLELFAGLAAAGQAGGAAFFIQRPGRSAMRARRRDGDRLGGRLHGSAAGRTARSLAHEVAAKTHLASAAAGDRNPLDLLGHRRSILRYSTSAALKTNPARQGF